MNLEEMQNVWQELTTKLEAQKHLTNSIIIDMTQEKFKNKISRIALFENLGALVCFLGAIAILLNSSKLDTWYLLSSGLFVAAYLIILPLVVLKYIRQMKRINLTINTYKQAITQFTKRRKQFLSVQRIGILSNFVLMILIFPVASKLINNKDLFLAERTEWFWYIAVTFLLLIPFSLWGYKKYSRMTAAAQRLLQDLES